MKTTRQTISIQRSTDSRIHKRLGGAVVEFAIVVPLFFLFLFAAIEFGRLNMVRHMVDNAAYEAARNAMVPGASTQEAINEANRVLALTGITGAQTHIATVQLGEVEVVEEEGEEEIVNEQIDDETIQVTVTITVPFAANAFLTPAFATDANIVSSSTLKTERYFGIQ